MVPFFTKGDKLDLVLAEIEKEALSHVPDVSTLKGRNAIKAHITKIKAYRISLEASGKELAAEYKLIPKKIDETRRKAKDFIGELESNARITLTKWEELRKAEEKQASDTESFNVKYENEHSEALQQNELLDLRVAKEKREREEEIKKAAEEAAAAARLQAENEAAEKIAAAERERIQLEQQNIAAQKQIEQNEIDRLNNIEMQKQRDIDAKNKRIKDEEKARQDAIDAAERSRVAEINRVAEIAAQEEAERVRRENDKAHKSKVYGAVKQDLMTHCGLSEDDAKLVVKALASNKINCAGIYI